jgi:hypothetical protein
MKNLIIIILIMKLNLISIFALNQMEINEKQEILNIFTNKTGTYSNSKSNSNNFET